MDEKHIATGRAKGFTLVEILVVVAMMCVIMGIALPAFTKMAKGGSAVMGARNLTAKVNACKSYAISQRKCVALVFPENEAGVPDSLRYTSYRPALITYNSLNSPPFTFVKWIDNESWDSIPTGALVMPKIGSTTLSDGSPPPLLTCDFADALNKASSSTTKIAIQNYFIIKPYGNIIFTDRSTSALTMFVREGVYSGGVSGTFTPSTTSNSQTLKINQYTAKITYANATADTLNN